MLDDLFGRLRRDAFGGHRLDRAGRGGEREETTKPYEFGDPFHLDLRGTLANALRREENAPAARPRRGERRVRLAPADFEVFRTEQLTRTSTVLLVDMSRSMLLRGCFLAAKKVAVALDTLIRTQFPRDHLAVIGFAYYAREIRPEALAELSWHGYEYGTNLQHGLMLARRILGRQHGGNARSWSSPTASRPPISRTARSSSAIRRRAGRSRRRSARCALHEGGDHDQHVHARAVAGAGRVRGARHAAQPRPGVLRDAGATRRVRPGGLRVEPDARGRLASQRIGRTPRDCAA